jgi:CDP-glycerol glycerophosphotransferase (TagB/SpsB family)
MAYTIIDERVLKSIPKRLSTLDSCLHYLDKHTVDLNILIANIGYTATLFDCACRSRGVPSYLIINGLLGPEYSDESKCADYINSYSESIARNYFQSREGVLPLGDPRMDQYCSKELKSINRKRPVVVIGGSGFNSCDLNSYVSVEFEFMHQVLSALEILKSQGQEMEIIIKVRPNAYKSQYDQFVNQYFPGLVSKIQATTPMKEVLERSDLYISIYSQTLFEASCLGIPVIYYRADVEVMFEPFDAKSELVTVTSPEQLVVAFEKFVANDDCYLDFLNPKVMEKYVGPLDGNNLNRNLEFIDQLLNQVSGDV